MKSPRRDITYGTRKPHANLAEITCLYIFFKGHSGTLHVFDKLRNTRCIIYFFPNRQYKPEICA